MTLGVVLTLSVLLALVVFLVAQLVPGTRAVRVRNALLLEPSQPDDFSWMPPRFPPGFKVERRKPDGALQQVVALLRGDAQRADWDLSLALAAHLTEHAQDKGPVRADPITTYRAIRAGYGYCADFVKVFLALAHASDIVARQWAFSFDGFGGHGHTVVEVFDRQCQRWRMIDVYNNFHVVDIVSGEPLGVIEYRDALLGRRERAVMTANGPGRLAFVHEHKAIEYYQRGLDQWYLWWGNAVLSYYAHPAVEIANRFSRTLAHLAGNVVGVQPRIHIYATPENVGAVHRLVALRRRIRLVTLALAILIAMLGVQLAVARFSYPASPA